MFRSFPFAAALFDLDGVLADTTALHYRVWEEFARQQGRALTQPELLATNGRRAEETLQGWFGADLSPERLHALVTGRELLFHRLATATPPTEIAGARRYLALLRRAGVVCALATSAWPRNAELVVRALGLGDSFAALVTSGDVTRGKPDPEPYLKAARAAGVDPRECVVFEDSLLGVRAAKAAGAKCVALSTTCPAELLRAERPDWLVADFDAIPPELIPHA